MSITKADLLQVAAQEIKDICKVNKDNCMNCPVAHKGLYEDDDRCSHWEAHCPFNSASPAEWNLPFKD